MMKLQSAYTTRLATLILAFLVQALPASAEFYFGKVRKLDATSRIMVLETTEGRTKQFTVPASELPTDMTEGASIFMEVSQDQVKRIRLIEKLPLGPLSPIPRSEGGGSKESRPLGEAFTEGSGGAR